MLFGLLKFAVLAQSMFSFGRCPAVPQTAETPAVCRQFQVKGNHLHVASGAKTILGHGGGLGMQESLDLRHPQVIFTQGEVGGRLKSWVA